MTTQRHVTQLATLPLVAYSAMTLGPSIFQLVINVMLPQLYAKELGLAFAKLGIALLAIRIIDSVLDQVAGILSDWTRHRLGSRKIWIALGMALMLGACFKLFIPPADVDIFYFVAWRVVYDIGWTLFHVSYTAWGAELSTNYEDRSRIAGYSGIATNLGVVLKSVAPIVLFWAGLTQSSAFTMESFTYLYWIALPVISLITLVTVLKTPPGPEVSRKSTDLKGLFRSVRCNPPFWIYITSFLVTALGQGITGLLFTFYDSYLQLGPFYPYLMTGFGVITVLSIPLWIRISNRVGKHRAYAASAFIAALSLQAFWLIDPVQNSQVQVAMYGGVVLLLVSFSTSCAFVAPAAILADVVDYATWRTGVARAGSYFAFYSLVTKIAMAVGNGFGFLLLGAFGYEVGAGAVNDASATFGLMFTVLLLPGGLMIAGGLIILRFPLTARRHAILQRRIARLQAAL